MTTTRKIQMALFAAVFTAANAVYSTHLRAQTEVENPDCGGQVHCSSSNPGVCGSNCGCGVGLGRPQCYKA